MNYRLSKDERGMSQVLMVIVAVIVLGGIGYAGWMVKNKNDVGPSNASLSKTEKTALKASEAECLKTENDKDLCKFMTNWSAEKKYMIDMTNTDAAGASTKMMMTLDGDNTYLKTDGQYAMEIITMGTTTYTKAGTTWYKQTTKPAAAADTTPKVDKVKFDAPKADTPVADKTVYTKVGMEACGKLTCFKYKVVDPSSKDTQFIWFDTKDYLVRKLEDTQADGSKSTMVFTYDNVSVKVPSPVKELTANQYIVPGQTEPTTIPDYSAEAAAAQAAAAASVQADSSSTDDSGN